MPLHADEISLKEKQGPPGQYFCCNNKGKAFLWPSPSKYLASRQLCYTSLEEIAWAKTFSNEANMVEKRGKKKENNLSIYKARRL